DRQCAVVESRVGLVRPPISGVEEGVGRVERELIVKMVLGKRGRAQIRRAMAEGGTRAEENGGRAHGKQQEAEPPDGPGMTTGGFQAAMGERQYDGDAEGGGHGFEEKARRDHGDDLFAVFEKLEKESLGAA